MAISDSYASELVEGCKAAGITETEFKAITGWDFTWATNATHNRASQIERRIAEARAPKPGIASEAQIRYILRLIAQGRRDEGGFYNGPRDAAGIAALTRIEASTYIDSLTGQY